MKNKKLHFRRQFILGPKEVYPSDDWACIKIMKNLFLSTHPDLSVHKTEEKNNIILLIGYILDPYHTFWDSDQIVQYLIKSSSNIDDLFENISVMGGRYVLIARINDESIIFNDPVGYRQIYYTIDKEGNTWCASQPARIAEAIEINEDERIKNELNKIELFKDTSEYWLPGELTIYNNVHHLIPNHYLNLDKKRVYRFWPKNNIEPLSLNEVAEDSSKLMQGIMKSAANRFNLALGVTAGADTRVILAASKDIANKIYFFTYTHPGLDENGPDIAIPRQILEANGLDHHIIPYDDNMDDDFKYHFFQNTQIPRVMKGNNANTVYKYFKKTSKEMLVCNGEIGGIAKRFYRLPYFLPLNGTVLSILTKMAGSKHIEESHERWLESAKIAQKHGIHILDLLYLEGRMANWSSMATSEYDIAFDSLSPFNCRRIIQNFLYAPKNYRKSGSYKIHNALINYMWPELSKYPINPQIGIKNKIKKRIFYSNTYMFLKFAKIIAKYIRCK